MEDFISFDPGVTPDPIPGKIQRLSTSNALLTLGLIVALSLVVHYGYSYYQTRDEFEPE
jgi:hypothetical protein